MLNVTRRFGLAVAVLGLIVGVSGQARAGLITSTSAFSGNESVVTFNALPTGNYTGVGGMFTMGGVTFSSSNSSLNINQWGPYLNTPGASQGAALNDTVGKSDITIDFGSAAVFRAGLLLSTGLSTSWTVAAYDTAGNFIESGTATNAAGNPVFIGFEASQMIGHLRVSETFDNSQVTIIDDVRFEVSAVPEPSSIALVCTALPMGLGLAWKRRKAASAATD